MPGVVEHGLEWWVLELLLDALRAEGLVGAGGKARTDSTHVISAVRDLNRLELAGKSARAAVEAVAAPAPDWLAGGATHVDTIVFTASEAGDKLRERLAIGTYSILGPDLDLARLPRTVSRWTQHRCGPSIEDIRVVRPPPH